ncbi:unnamed protein product [Fusarium venenatum]|uniref:Uncharacterized protein n=1 Tax=Fusarium venenatum TaxID=56646 RepID=A0A2L2TII7_9HYPO|nr:uncharacterized protein FVRRES_07272 [Fusarium venenatum]CEI62836.1 unnamed protein product [Fusarium venenatum]
MTDEVIEVLYFYKTPLVDRRLLAGDDFGAKIRGPVVDIARRRHCVVMATKEMFKMVQIRSDLEEAKKASA